MILSDKEEIFELIQMFFETGKTKDFSILRKIQLDSPEFSSFSDVPPYGLQNYSESVALEELRFSSISDYNFELKTSFSIKSFSFLSNLKATDNLFINNSFNLES